MKRIITFVIGLALPAILFSQQLASDVVPSILLGLDDNFQTEWMPSLNMDAIEAEDLRREQNGELPMFGRIHQTDLGPHNVGTWTQLANGDRLWRLKIVSPGAEGTVLYYTNFNLAPNTALFVHNGSGKYYTGPFTSKDYQKSLEYSSGILPGEEVILEYFIPGGVDARADFIISGVGHAYRHTGYNLQKGFGN